MNLLRLVWALMRRRPASLVFNILTLALGASVVLCIILLEQSIENRFTRDLAGIDLIIGAKGSPLQILLSTLMQADTPTGNIPLAAAQRFAQHPLVKTAVPVSIGDSVHGMRIVGTTPEYAALYAAHLSSGQWWVHSMQAVLGADAASRLKLQLHSRFIGEHGLTGGRPHTGLSYEVVGILAPTDTVLDQLVLTDLASVWEVHAHHDADEPGVQSGEQEKQVTALLIRYRSPLGVVLLPQQVRATADLQPAVPAVEVARLVILLGVGARTLNWIGFTLLGLSAGGFLMALISAVSERRRELALLRALGARAGLLLYLVSLEGLILGFAGGVLGIGFSRLLMSVISIAAEQSGVRLQAPPMGALELMALALAVGLALVSAMAPALRARQIDPAQELA